MTKVHLKEITIKDIEGKIRTMQGKMASNVDEPLRKEKYREYLNSRFRDAAKNAQMSEFIDEDCKIIAQKKEDFFKKFLSNIDKQNQNFNIFYKALCLSEDDPVVIELINKIVDKFFQAVSSKKDKEKKYPEIYRNFILEFLNIVLKPSAVGECDKSERYKAVRPICDRINKEYNSLEPKSKLICNQIYRRSRAILARIPDTSKKIIQEEIERFKRPINKEDLLREFQMLPPSHAVKIKFQHELFSFGEYKSKIDKGEIVFSALFNFAFPQVMNIEKYGSGTVAIFAEKLLDYFSPDKKILKVDDIEYEIMPNIFIFSRVAFWLYSNIELVKNKEILDAILEDYKIDISNLKSTDCLKFAADFYPTASLELAKLYNPLCPEKNDAIAKNAQKALEYYVIVFCCAINENDYEREKQEAITQCQRLISKKSITPQEAQKILSVRLSHENVKKFMKQIGAAFQETDNQEEFRKAFATNEINKVISAYKKLTMAEKVAVLQDVNIEVHYAALSKPKTEKESCYEILTIYFNNKGRYDLSLLFALKLTEFQKNEAQERIKEILQQEQDGAYITLPKASEAHLELAKKINIPELSLAIARTFWKEKEQEDFAQKAQEILQFALQSDFSKKSSAQKLYFKISLFNLLKGKLSFDENADPDFTKIDSLTITSQEFTSLCEQLANSDLDPRLYQYLEKFAIENNNLENFLGAMNADLRKQKAQELFDKVKDDGLKNILINYLPKHEPEPLVLPPQSPQQEDYSVAEYNDSFLEFQRKLAAAIRRQDSTESILNNIAINQEFEAIKFARNLSQQDLKSQHFICLGDLYRISGQNDKAMECYLTAAGQGAHNMIYEFLAIARYCKLALDSEEKISYSYPFFHLIRSYDVISSNFELFNSFPQDLGAMIITEIEEAFFKIIQVFDSQEKIQQSNSHNFIEVVEKLLTEYYRNKQKTSAFVANADFAKEQKVVKTENQDYLTKEITATLVKLDATKKHKLALLKKSLDSFDANSNDITAKKEIIINIFEQLKSVYNHNLIELEVIKIRNNLLLKKDHNPFELEEMSRSLQDLINKDFIGKFLNEKNEAETNAALEAFDWLAQDDLTLNIVKQIRMECVNKIRETRKDQTALIERFNQIFLPAVTAQENSNADLVRIKNISWQIENIGKTIPVVNQLHELCGAEEALKSQLPILSQILHKLELKFAPAQNHGKYNNSPAALVQRPNAAFAQEKYPSGQFAPPPFIPVQPISEETAAQILEDDARDFAQACNDGNFAEVNRDLLIDYQAYFKSLLARAGGNDAILLNFDNKEFLDAALEHMTLAGFEKLNNFLARDNAVEASENPPSVVHRILTRPVLLNQNAQNAQNAL